MIEESPELRLQKYLSLIPLIGEPFPYNPKICDLPSSMMFMHDAVFSIEDYTPNIDLCSDFSKEKEMPVLRKNK